MTSFLKRTAALSLSIVALTACKGSTPTATNGSAPPPASIDSSTPTPSASKPSSSAPTTTTGSRTATASGAPVAEPVKKADPSVPPAAGTYTYKQSGETKAGTFTIPVDPTGTLVIDRATNGGGGKRSHQSRTYSSNESQEQTFVFKSTGVYLESTVASIYGQKQECTTADPLLAVKLPLKVGASWTDSGACEGVTISIKAKILREESYAVGGTKVDAFVMRVTADAKGDNVTQHTVETIWFSPDYRLILHSVSDGNGSGQGIEFTSHREETLTSLKPG